MRFPAAPLAGRFRIVERIGSGGMGIVYRGEDTLTGQAVAVKVPHEAMCEDAEYRRYFAREAEKLQLLTHPGIVEVLHVGAFEDTPYIVTSFLPGGDLRQRVERTPNRRLHWSEVANWLPTLVAALDHMHAAGIVHRDIKPQNILFDGTGRPRLSDFGLAKSSSDDLNEVTVAGGVPGTPAYMAPEQMEHAVPTSAADQYSLGTTLYYVLSGSTPFTGSPFDIVVNKRTGAPTPILDHVPDLPVAASRAVMRTLARDPLQRFARCADFARAFVQHRNTWASRSGGEDAERRQLTVLSCQLSDLSAEMEPEELLALVRAYEERMATIVQRYDGYVARSVGIGQHIYFGYPRAHEDDPIRAVLAGLEMLEDLATIEWPSHLPTAKVGIASGVVVVDDHDAIGAAPSLAVRLQDRALPGTLLVSEHTLQLTGNAFHSREFALEADCDMEEPLHCHEVLGRASTMRFGGDLEAPHSALVGRSEELDLILTRWQGVRSGEGQVVLLSGEAGIGKSRVSLALRERLRDEEHLERHYQCSPYHEGSPLYPVMQELRSSCGLDADVPTEVKLHDLKARFATLSAPQRALIAEFAGLPAPEQEAPQRYSPQRQKELTIRALQEDLIALAARQPLLVLVEDVHWIDPTTLTFIDGLIELSAAHRILILLTCRPEFKNKWKDESHVTVLSLTRLSRAQSGQLATRVAEGRSLPQELLEEILDRTGGIPLFLEEVTKATLEASGRAAGVPATLKASLTARLDELDDARNAAQLGSVFGREFQHRLLVALTDQDEKSLEIALARLTASQLIQRIGRPPQCRYVFKHALVQDAAYESLLLSRRRQLHKRVHEILIREDQIPPEELARHATEAGLAEEAIAAWLQAGAHAQANSALSECIRHFEAGLALLDRLQDSALRQHYEFELQAAIGSTHMMSRGYASPEAEHALRRARALGHELLAPGATGGGQTSRESFFRVLWGIYAYYVAGGQQVRARAVVDELAAEADSDIDLQVQADSLLVVSQFYLGEIEASAASLERLLALYDADRHGNQVWSYQHDASIHGRIYGQLLHWLLGRPEQARQLCEETIACARKLGHPFMLVFVLIHGTTCQVQRRSARAHLACVDEAIAIAREVGFPLYVALGTIHRGWALSQLNDLEAGIAAMRQGIADWQATGAGILMTWSRTLLAEALLAAGRVDEAEIEVTEALRLGDEHQELWCGPESLRIRARVHAARGDAVSAERVLLDALDLARGARALGWELRLATDLARLWQETGRGEEARALLAPCHARFTEGHDTPDLQEAAQLL